MITPSCRLETCGVFPVCTALQGRPCYLSLSMRAKGVTACSITNEWKGSWSYPDLCESQAQPISAPYCHSKILVLSFLFHFSLYCSHVCLVYVHVPVCMLVHMCGHGVCCCTRMLWPEAKVRSSLIALSGLASPSACLLPESPVYGLRAEITGGPLCTADIYVAARDLNSGPYIVWQVLY